MSSFTPREMEIMGHAWQSITDFPNVNYDRLASLAGMSNPRSASNAWSAIKKKLTANAASDGTATALSAREMQLMGFAWQCMDAAPAPDFTKIASLLGLTNPRSVSNMWTKIKKKITAAPGSGSGAADDDDAVANGTATGEDGAGGTPSKAKRQRGGAAAGTKRKATKSAKEVSTSDNDEDNEDAKVKGEGDGDAKVKHEEDEDDDELDNENQDRSFTPKSTPKRARIAKTTVKSEDTTDDAPAVAATPTPSKPKSKPTPKPKTRRAAARKPTKAELARSAAAAGTEQDEIKPADHDNLNISEDDPEHTTTTPSDPPTRNHSAALPVIDAPVRPIDQFSGKENEENERVYEEYPATPGAEYLDDEGLLERQYLEWAV